MNKLAKIIIEDVASLENKIDFNSLNNQTILMTGASGLLGVYFLATLKSLTINSDFKIKVYAIINSAPEDYIKDFLDFEGASIIQGDLSDIGFLQSLPSADVIIHAAGYGQPGRFMFDPVKTLQLNTKSTFELFEKLNTNGKFLFISTSEVYSGLSTPPFSEDQIGTTNTTHLRSCYIEAKRCGEAICNAYRSKGVNAKSARLALAYGPGTKKNDMRVLNSFIQKALNGKIALMDQGEAKRTYCYILDAIEIMWNILLHGNEPVYNVGGTSRTSIKELATSIADQMKVPLEFPVAEAGNTGAPDDVYLDLQKVAKAFNKKTYVPLEEGLLKTIEWQKILYS